MKFLSITGPKEDIGRVTEKYLSKYEIHLENALSELKEVKNLMPYIQRDMRSDTDDQIGQTSVARYRHSPLRIAVDHDTASGPLRHSPDDNIGVKHFRIAELFKELFPDTPAELRLSGCQSIYGYQILAFHNR